MPCLTTNAPYFTLAVQAVHPHSSHIFVLDDQDALLHLGGVEDVVDELKQALARQLNGGDGLNGLRGAGGVDTLV